MKISSQILLSASTALYLLSSPLMAMNEDPLAGAAGAPVRLAEGKESESAPKKASTAPEQDKMSELELQIARSLDMKEILTTLLFAEGDEKLQDYVEAIVKKSADPKTVKSPFGKHLHVMAQRKMLGDFLVKTTRRAKAGTLFLPLVDSKGKPVFSKEDKLSDEEEDFLIDLLAYHRYIKRAPHHIEELGRNVKHTFAYGMYVAHAAGTLDNFVQRHVLSILDRDLPKYPTPNTLHEYCINRKYTTLCTYMRKHQWYAKGGMNSQVGTLTKVWNMYRAGTLSQELAYTLSESMTHSSPVASGLGLKEAADAFSPIELEYARDAQPVLLPILLAEQRGQLATFVEVALDQVQELGERSPYPTRFALQGLFASVYGKTARMLKEGTFFTAIGRKGPAVPSSDKDLTLLERRLVVELIRATTKLFFKPSPGQGIFCFRGISFFDLMNHNHTIGSLKEFISNYKKHFEKPYHTFYFEGFGVVSDNPQERFLQIWDKVLWKFKAGTLPPKITKFLERLREIGLKMEEQADPVKTGKAETKSEAPEDDTAEETDFGVVDYLKTTLPGLTLDLAMEVASLQRNNSSAGAAGEMAPKKESSKEVATEVAQTGQIGTGAKPSVGAGKSTATDPLSESSAPGGSKPLGEPVKAAPTKSWSFLGVLRSIFSTSPQPSSTGSTSVRTVTTPGDEFRGSGLGLGGQGSGSGRSATSHLESKGDATRNTSGTTGAGSAGSAGSARDGART